MTVLRRRRPEAPTPESRLLTMGDHLLARGERGERARSSLRGLRDALGGAGLGLAAGVLISLGGLAQVQPMAAALAGLVASLAVKVTRDHAQRMKVAALDLPGGRDLAEKVLVRLGRGQMATRKGALWVVFDRLDQPPRILSEAVYLRHVRSVLGMVEIDATRQSLFLTRLTYGRADSVLSGLPSIEAFDHAGFRYATDWHIAGEKADREAVMRARALSDPEPIYEEDVFRPRI